MVEIGTVKTIEIEQEMKNAYLSYAMSVITARALPDVRDGLKPVQRRILYTMGEMGLRHSVAFKKCARIVGDVMGRYHPHGDQPVYESLVRMAQDFTMRYPLVDGQGNFGCFTGDTKIKLLDGTEKSFAELAELDPREIFYIYSVDKNGRVTVGEGRNARVTRRNARLIELTLDNGETLCCTPDHKFMLRNGAYKAAQDLTPDDSLMPGHFDTAPVKEGLNDYLRNLDKALTYFSDFNEMLDAAAKHNHRIISKRWLDERADVYDITVDLHHNFLLASGIFVHNSIDDDPAAAMRYTEARLTEIAEEMLADIDRDTVNFGENFDGSLKEPRVLPAKVPNLLLNGTAGIAVGMATSIPPHNLSELVDATKYLIDRWEKIDDVEVDDLMRFVQGPDFPTAGVILGAEGIREAYATGKGRIVVRGKIHTEEAGGGKARIVISELPYQVNKAALIERIADLVRDHKIEDIGDLRDESDRQGMSIVVELKRGADAKPVVNQLFKYTPLQSGFSINMLALVDGEPRVLSLKRMLQLYIQHRQEVITRRTQFDLEKAKARAHILEGLKIALDHLDEVIKTIRQSPDADAAKDRLMKRFKLDEIQAQAILDMQLRRLAALERKKIEEELAETRKQIKHLEDLLKHPKKILSVISEELTELKRKFGDARRTHITEGAEEPTEFKEEDLVQEQDVLVSVTQRGYISRVPLSSVRRTATGSKSVQTREEDAVQYLFVANTRDTLLFFTNRGKVYPLRAHQVPDVERQPKGLPLNNFLSFEQNERVTSAVAVPDFSAAEFLTMATLMGRAKRTPLAEFDGIRASGVAAINLNEGDELGWARLTHGDGELLFVTEQGQALRCKEEDVPVQGRVAGGVYGIKLNEGDKVASMDLAQPDGFVLVVTAKGFGKRTPIKEYTLQGRYTKGVATLGRDVARAGVIAAARVVNEDDEVTIISANGVVLRARVANLPKARRTSKESEVMKLKEGDAVASIARLEAKAEGDKEKGERQKRKTVETRE